MSIEEDRKAGESKDTSEIPKIKSGHRKARLWVRGAGGVPSEIRVHGTNPYSPGRLGFLHPILGAPRFSGLKRLKIPFSAHQFILQTRNILGPSSTKPDGSKFLQLMAFPRNVSEGKLGHPHLFSRTIDLVPDTGDFSLSRVRLPRGRGKEFKTDGLPLRLSFQCGNRYIPLLLLTL